jgi:hypothetical protein
MRSGRLATEAPDAFYRAHCSESSATMLGATCKAVGAPVFAAHTVMNEEEPVGIVFPLDDLQARIVLSPVIPLPGAIEVVTLRNIRARVRSDLAQLHRRQSSKPPHTTSAAVVREEAIYRRLSSASLRKYGRVDESAVSQLRPLFVLEVTPRGARCECGRRGRVALC